MNDLTNEECVTAKKMFTNHLVGLTPREQVLCHKIILKLQARMGDEKGMQESYANIRRWEKAVVDDMQHKHWDTFTFVP